jgi:hypothetical protein
MAVRFWEEGYEYLDSMSGATTAGSVLTYDDASRTAPWEDRPGYGQNDLIAAESMRWMAVPREEMIRPPVPQVMWPPRYGYGEQVQPTISDILGGRLTQVTPRPWVFPETRLRRDYEEQQMWSGSERNAQITVNPML